MTEYGKTKLNKAIKSYIVLNEQKKAIEKSIKPLGEEIKTAMTEADVTVWETTGVVAKLSETYTETLDKEMVESRIKTVREAVIKALGGSLPPELDKLISINDCYKHSSSVRLNVKANMNTAKAAVKAIAAA